MLSDLDDRRWPELQPRAQMAEVVDEIRAFWKNILKALSTVAGMCVLLCAHWLVDALLGRVLGGSEMWTRYHGWVEAITFGAFYMVYICLMIEFVELFIPAWLRSWFPRPTNKEYQVPS